jgi:uncharacterized repeat protein (TIGR03803 family)
MKNSKSLRTLSLALACAAVTFGLAVRTQAQTVTYLLGRDGNLYGVTSQGGVGTNSGTFYRLTLAGELTTLWTFCSQFACAPARTESSWRAMEIFVAQAISA